VRQRVTSRLYIAYNEISASH